MNSKYLLRMYFVYVCMGYVSGRGPTIETDQSDIRYNDSDWNSRGLSDVGLWACEWYRSLSDLGQYFLIKT